MLMETLDAWEGVHPGMATVPVDAVVHKYKDQAR